MSEPTKQPWFFRFQADVNQDGAIADNKIDLCWQYCVAIDGEILKSDKVQIEVINLIDHPEIYAQVVALQQALALIALAQIAAREQAQVQSPPEPGITDTLGAITPEPETLISATEGAIAPPEETLT